MSSPSERLCERLFARADHPIFLLDPGLDRVRYANRCACALLGYGADELLRVPVSRLFRAGEPGLGAFLKAVGEHGDAWTTCLALRTKAGIFRPAEVLASRLVIDEQLYVLVLANDRSQHRSRLDRNGSRNAPARE